MLQKILGAHPDIHTVSEPWLALHPLFALRESGIATDYDSRLAQRAVTEFLTHFPEGEEAYWSAVRLMLGRLYNRALEESGKSIFLDKTPRYYFVIPELRRVFPDARFVFLVRNPLAVLASILETWASSEDPAQLRPYRCDLLIAPQLLLDGIRTRGPNDVVARYEELVSDPEAAVRRLCQNLRISFHPSMIEYGAGAKTDRWLYGDQETVYRQSRPTAERVDRWRDVLKRSPEWETWAQSYLATLGPDVVGELGYDYRCLSADLPPSSAPSGWVARISGFPAEVGGGQRGMISLERAVTALYEQELRATALITELEKRAEILEKAAADRLREIQAITAEAERRAQLLETLTEAIKRLERETPSEYIRRRWGARNRNS